MSGTLSQSQELVKTHLQRYGGRVAGSVTKKTSFLFAGEDAGGKLETANEIKVPVLDEGALGALLEKWGIPLL